MKALMPQAISMADRTMVAIVGIEG